MMVIDPNMNGCEVWYNDMVQHLTVTHQESIERIFSFLKKRRIIEKLDKSEYYWSELKTSERYIITFHSNIPIYVDVTAMGRHYANFFINAGIPFIEVKGRRFL